MNATEFQKSVELAKKFEGLSLKAYRCPAGVLTIGFGRNIQENGISKEEAELLLRNDLNRVWQEALTLFPEMESWTPNRRLAIIDMMFNLGLTKFRKFVNTIKYIKSGNWDLAAQNASKSLWYTQVGKRSKQIVKMIKEG